MAKVIKNNINKIKPLESPIEINNEVVNITKEKKEYRVILATKTYYIINVDGVNIIIKSFNNYSEGDLVLY